YRTASQNIRFKLNDPYTFYVPGAPVLIVHPEQVPVYVTGIFIGSCPESVLHQPGGGIVDDYRSGIYDILWPAGGNVNLGKQVFRHQVMEPAVLYIGNSGKVFGGIAQILYDLV